MELRWEWVRNGVFHGFGDNGECVAQVENMIGTSGSTGGEHCSNVHYSLSETRRPS